MDLSNQLESFLTAESLALIRLIRTEAERLDFPLYLVGGSVRDLLLGRPINDFDLTVEGEAAHLDLYRIAAASELDFLGLQDLVPELRLWLVEWPDRGLHGLPAPDLEIELQVDGSGRRLSLEPGSDIGRRWLDDLAQK